MTTLFGKFTRKVPKNGFYTEGSPFQIFSNIFKLISMTSNSVPTIPTLTPPKDAPNATLLPTARGIKKPTVTRIAPPEIGTESPRLTLPSPVPTAIELDTKNTLWRSQPIGGLWTNDQNQNGWVWFNQENWVRLSDATESGLMAMMMLAASGKETGTPCLSRRDSDGKICELYLL
jgi:hypothetical protein